jgi:CRP/FNR family transcriptional regulator
MHTETIIDILKRVDLFGGLQEEYLAFLADIAREMHVDKGQPVFWAGDAGNGFYLVRSGRVKIFRTSFSGKEHILHVFGFGEAFGEVAVFAGDRFPASAVALEASQLLFFPRKTFRGLLAREPDLALQMLALLSRRLRCCRSNRYLYSGPVQDRTFQIPGNHSRNPFANTQKDGVPRACAGQWRMHTHP